MLRPGQVTDLPLRMTLFDEFANSIVNMVDPRGMQVECNGDVLCLIGIGNTITHRDEGVMREFCRAKPELCGPESLEPMFDGNWVPPQKREEKIPQLSSAKTQVTSEYKSK